MDLNTRIDNLEIQVKQLTDLVNSLNFPDNKQYDKTLTSNSLFVSRGKGILVKAKTNIVGSEIRTGVSDTDTNIKAEIGYTSSPGSLYLSTNPSKPLWVMFEGSWVNLNTP